MGTAVAEKVVLSPEQQTMIENVRRMFALIESQTDEQLVNAVRSIAFVFAGFPTFSAWLNSEYSAIIGVKKNGERYARSLRVCTAAWMLEKGKTATVKAAFMTIANLTPKKPSSAQSEGACVSAADLSRAEIDAAVKALAVSTTNAVTAALVDGGFMMDFSKKSEDSINQIKQAIAAGLSTEAVKHHAEVQIQRYQQLLASL